MPLQAYWFARLSLELWGCGPFALLSLCSAQTLLGHLSSQGVEMAALKVWTSQGPPLELQWLFPTLGMPKPGCLSCLRLTTSSPRPTTCRHHSCSFAEPRELTSSRLFPQVVWLAAHAALMAGSNERRPADRLLNAASEGALQTLVTSAGVAVCIHLFTVSSVPVSRS